MKKIVLLLSVVCSLFIVGGCGNDNKSDTTNANKEEYADKAFLEDFKQGLYNRWDFTNDSANESIETTEYYKILADKELEKISKYKDKKFKDSTLQEYAIKYINILNKSKSFDDETYERYYLLYDEDKTNDYYKLYIERTSLIKDIVGEYKIKFDKKHEEDYKDIINNNSKAVKDAEKDSKIKAIVENLSFEKKDDSYYEAIAENNSGYNISDLDLSINLLNSDGIVVDTANDYIQNIENGQKFLVKIYADSNTTFTSTKVEVTYYQTK